MLQFMFFIMYSVLPTPYGAKPDFLILPENFIFPRDKPFFSQDFGIIFSLYKDQLSDLASARILVFAIRSVVTKPNTLDTQCVPGFTLLSPFFCVFLQFFSFPPLSPKKNRFQSPLVSISNDKASARPLKREESAVEI